MNKLEYVDEINGIQFYSYRPSIRNLYYSCYSGDEIPPYFSRFIHRLRMMREIYKSNYRVVYMKKEDKIVGHLVVGRGGSRIEMSTEWDIIIGPIWIIPECRSLGYASQGIRFVLNNMGLEYQFAYEYIEKENIASIRTVEKNGFEFVDECDEYGVFKVIRPLRGGHLRVYRVRNPRD